MLSIIHLGAGSGSPHLNIAYKAFDRLLGVNLKKKNITSTPIIGKNSRNAGDKVLTEAFQYMIKEKFNAKLIPYMDCRRIYTERDINYINKQDALVVGGGGLFLSDTFENEVSDWQWGISDELINNINIPIFVLSLGYNKFRDQREFMKEFDRSVSSLVKQAAFFSMRHTGDINKLKKHIPKSLHKKVKLHFCPTLLFNKEKKYNYQANYKEKNVGFNFAGDRIGYRHKDLKLFINHIKSFMLYVKRKGYTAHLIIHNAKDNWIRKYVDFDKIIDLTKEDSKNILKSYSGMEYVIGDRGHSQMLAYSVGCKIITPISHDKLKFFLEDVNLTDTGVEVNDEELSGKLINAFDALKDNNLYIKRWKEGMVLIEENNKENMKQIINILND